MNSISSRSAYFWGTTSGLILALTLTIANDLGLGLWPVVGAQARAAHAEASDTVPLFLADVPMGYTVSVDGVDSDAEHNSAGISLFVSQGSHTISLEGPDGVVWTQRLPAGAAPDTLSPHFGGEIAVDVLPQARGGIVYLDGEPVGEAPGDLANVVPGWHVVSVRSGEETVYEEACYVETGKVSVVSVPPAPPLGRAQLRVASRILTEVGFQPLQGSRVFVNGELKGKVPLDLDLPRGFHSIRVEHRTQKTLVEVVYLPAGQTRQLIADFGREDRLEVRALAPEALTAGLPAAIPVVVDFDGEARDLVEANVLLVRQNQSEPVTVPLSPVKNGSGTWLAYLPETLTGAGTLRGYASCRDARGRAGQSELFSVVVR